MFTFPYAGEMMTAETGCFAGEDCDLIKALKGTLNQDDLAPYPYLSPQQTSSRACCSANKGSIKFQITISAFALVALHRLLSLLVCLFQLWMTP